MPVSWLVTLSYSLQDVITGRNQVKGTRSLFIIFHRCMWIYHPIKISFKHLNKHVNMFIMHPSPTHISQRVKWCEQMVFH